MKDRVDKSIGIVTRMQKGSQGEVEVWSQISLTLIPVYYESIK
jgi:hypothetical protein